MNWLEIVLILVVVLGLFSGVVLVARSPTFWVGLFGVMIQTLLPYILKRMPPEQEEEWRKCQLKGGKWNYRKRKCE
jgi:uncharacterized membrane protein